MQNAMSKICSEEECFGLCQNDLITSSINKVSLQVTTSHQRLKCVQSILSGQFPIHSKEVLIIETKI